MYQICLYSAGIRLLHSIMGYTYLGAFKRVGMGLLYSLIEETYLGAFKSVGIGLLHSIMGHIYPEALKSVGQDQITPINRKSDQNALVKEKNVQNYSK